MSDHASKYYVISREVEYKLSIKSIFFLNKTFSVTIISFVQGYV